MKGSIVRVLVTLGFGATLSPIALLAQEPVRATIPFDFTVGVKTLPAGDYTVSQRNGIVLIENSRRTAHVMTFAMKGEWNQTPGKYSILFHRYGDSNFLAAVRGDGWGLEWKATPAEKELIAKAAASSKPVVVAAK